MTWRKVFRNIATSFLLTMSIACSSPKSAELDHWEKTEISGGGLRDAISAYRESTGSWPSGEMLGTIRDRIKYAESLSLVRKEVRKAKYIAKVDGEIIEIHVEVD